MRDVYIQSLNELSNSVAGLSARLEYTLEKTRNALMALDKEAAKEIYDGDDEIDRLVREIMRRDLTIGVMQAPVATDWRNLMSTFKILSDMERVADHCADISKYIMLLAEKPDPILPLPGMNDMYKTMESMVRDSLYCYANGDDNQAEFLRDRDDVVDASFVNLLTELSRKMEADSSHIPSYIAYVLILKYIERMADHATNIADWVLYRKRNQLK